MPAQNFSGFAEKVALVTDASNEIGRAVALQLALQGCYVIAGFGETDDHAKNTLAELQSLGTLANAVEADCSTVEGARRLVAEVEKLYGRLDLLINTVKFAPDLSFPEMTEEVWTRNLDFNIKSVFFVTQAAVSLMRARPKPVIVNLASAGDTEEAARNVARAAARAGVIEMTRAMALELAPKFRVNCVAVSEKQISGGGETLDAELFRPKTGVVSAERVARTVVYLLSSEAAGLTSQVLTVG